MRAHEFINNDGGWGEVPNNHEVDYLGLRVQMKPSVFLRLASPLFSSEDTAAFADHLQQGGTFAAPFLKITIPEAWAAGDFTEPAEVKDHDGRHRMKAIMQVVGNDPVEVHLFPVGLRARHLTDEYKENLNRGMRAQDLRGRIFGPLFSL